MEKTCNRIQNRNVKIYIKPVDNCWDKLYACCEDCLSREELDFSSDETT